MNWIKMTDRKPGHGDYPILVYSPTHPLDGDDNNDGIYFRLSGQPIYDDVTHWMPANLPAPPPKEKTQKELDEEAFVLWGGISHPAAAAWHSALKWEREAWRALLDRPLDKNQEKWAVLNMGDMNALRKRCGL